MITRIHVNQHVIKRNQKTGEREPVLTIKRGGDNFYTSKVMIHGPSEVVYRPDRPLSCGARVWVETKSKVTADDLDDAFWTDGYPVGFYCEDCGDDTKS